MANTLKRFYVIYVQPSQTDYDVKMTTNTFLGNSDFNEVYDESCKILDMVEEGLGDEELKDRFFKSFLRQRDAEADAKRNS